MRLSLMGTGVKEDAAATAPKNPVRLWSLEEKSLMDERDRIVRRGFCGVGVVAPQIHALAQKGDGVSVIGVGRGWMRSNIMENPRD